MAYEPKTALQSFQSSWQKTLTWADSQKIPRTAWYPVYQLDAQKLLTTGYGMSNYERVRAITTSFNPNLVTGLPTDRTHPATTSSPNPLADIGGFLHNATTDLRNITTGLISTRLGPMLYDVVKNTVEHPEWMLDPKAKGENTLAALLIPGYSAAGQAASKGVGSLAQDPITTLIDVLPIFDGVTSIIGHAGAVGDAVARAARYPSGEAMAKAGSIRTAGRLLGNIPTSTKAAGILRRDSFGDTSLVRKSAFDRLHQYANAKLSGPELAQFNENLSRVTTTQSARLSSVMHDFAEVDKATSVDDQLEAHRVLSTPTDSDYAGIANDPNISPGAKAYIAAADPVLDWIQEIGLAYGDIEKIRLPNGRTEVFATFGTDAKVIKARTGLDKTAQKLDRSSKKLDALRDEIQANDNVVGPGYARLDTLTTRIRSARSADTEASDRQLLGFPVVPKGEPYLRRELHPGTPLATPGALIKPLTVTQSRLISDVFDDGAILDQAKTAFLNSNFRLFRDLTKEADGKLNAKILAAAHSPLLDEIRTLVKNMNTYASKRVEKEDQFARLRDHPKTGLRKATADHAAALTHFEKMVHDHPSAVWIPEFTRVFIRNLLKHDDGIKVMEAALRHKSETDVPHETIEQFRSNPETMMEIVTVLLDASSKAPFLSSIADSSFIFEARASALDEIDHLRSVGEPPRWVPNISSSELAHDPTAGSLNITIPSSLRKISPKMAHSRMLNISDSIYDISASITMAAKQIIIRDATTELVENHIIGHLTYTRQELVDLIEREIALQPQLLAHAAVGTRAAAINDIIDRNFDLTTFDPFTFGNLRTTKVKTGETLYIDKDILRGIESSVNEGQFPSHGLIASGTKVFRTAILALSPRYTAHILLGGTFLMALRDPLALAFMGKAVQFLHDPEKAATIHTISTQRGAIDPVFKASTLFHQSTGYQASQLAIAEAMSKGLSRVKAIADLNLRFTSYVTDMQRASTYLSARWKANLRKTTLDPETGQRVAMTEERAHEMGLRAVDKVMGNLSRMTPFERATLTKLMPFYGWTKHILTYVASYPLDHPYKAIILSHLANLNSAQVPAGLDLRIQQLFFLGIPDAMGNVSAIDVRALNPLRDVANYASLSGWLSGLNPAYTAAFAYVDPQIIFGGNTLYPNLTFNDVYGITEAAPQGSLLTAAEQYIPQVSALDAALQLSSKYRNLRQNNPAAFAKGIFEAFGVPFAEVQHLNIRQMAAKEEMARARLAAAAAQSYFQGKTPASSLAGYTDLPDPQNPIYSLSPAELEALVSGAETTSGGLPAAATLPNIPTPKVL